MINTRDNLLLEPGNSRLEFVEVVAFVREKNRHPVVPSPGNFHVLVSCQRYLREMERWKSSKREKEGPRAGQERETGSGECGAVMGHFRWSLCTPRTYAKSVGLWPRPSLSVGETADSPDRLSHHSIKRSQWHHRYGCRFGTDIYIHIYLCTSTLGYRNCV